MKYIQFILFFLFLLPLTSTKAQQAIPFSKIYLKLGGFLQGQVLQQDSLGIVSIRLRSGEEISLRKESIAKIKASSKTEKFHPEGHTTRTEGFYSKLQLGFLGGISSGEQGSLTSGLELFSFSVGHQFNPRWQVGGGVALDSYSHLFLPLFVEGKYILNPDKKTSWYLGLQAGYSFAFDLGRFSDVSYGGGSMVHPAIGLRFSGKRKSSFLLELGNRYQLGTSESIWSNTVDRIVFRRLALRVGWEF